MKRLVEVFLVLSLFMAGNAQAIEWVDKDCGEWRGSEGKVFELDVSMSFHGSIEFKLCQKRSGSFLVYRVDPDSHEMRESTPAEIRSLTESEFQSIVKKYESALRFNALDVAEGADGSNWCLDTQRESNYIKACFWSPELNAERRGLRGFYELGAFLYEMAGMKDKKIALY